MDWKQNEQALNRYKVIYQYPYVSIILKKSATACLSDMLCISKAQVAIPQQVTL
jgi:hypothetical protein